MKTKTLLFTVLTGLFLLSGARAEAAAYLKLDGIEGEATKAGYEGWSELAFLDFAIARPLEEAGSGRTRATATPGDFRCVMNVDKSSPRLVRALVLGELLPLVTIEFVRENEGGDQAYLKYELKNVLITSYSMNASGTSGSPPAESFSFDYEEITVIYTEYGSGGQPVGDVETTWKVEEETAS